MTIRITGDGPKITATGSGSTVLVAISTGQHDPGSFSGVHNDLTGRSTAGAHPISAITGLQDALDNAGGGGAVESVDGRTGAVTLDDLYQTVGVEVLTDSATLDGPPRTVVTAIVDGTVTFPTAGVGDVGQHWHIATGPYELTVVGCDGGDVTVPVGMVLSVVGYEAPGPVYGWATLGFKTINAPTGGGADLSDTTPQALGTAAAGTGTAAARDDHVHAMPTAADVGADADGAAQAVADTLGTAATKDVGTTAGTVAAGDDARLSDARTPVSHNHAASEVTSGTLDIARIPTGTTSTTVPLGNDSRFTDSRTPTSHASSHASAGSDPVTLAQSQVTNLTTDLAGKAASSHSHAGTDITSGTVGTARLGSGSASSSTFLRGDQTWATPSGIADPGGSNDDLLQRKSGAWTYRTPAQVKTDLGVSSPVTSIVPVAVGDYLHLPRGLGSTYAAFSPSSTATNSNGHVRYVPFFVDRGITFDELALHVVAGNAGASAVLRLGIFADNAGRPGTVVADAGTASLNSTGVKSLALSPAVALTHGWYWFAVATQGLDTAGTNPTYSALQNTTTLSGGTAVQASNQPYPFLSSSGITGAFANNPTVSMNYTGQPTTYNVYGKVSALA